MCARTPISFVDHVWETFGPLLAGACLLVPPRGLVLQPQRLLLQLAQHGVTHLVCVPSLLRLLLPALRAWRQQGKSNSQDQREQISDQQDQDPNSQEQDHQDQDQYDQNQEGLQQYHKHQQYHRHRQPGPALSLRLLVSSGEPLGSTLAGRLLDCLPPGCRLINLYGK